ncbi:MAG: sulfite exporter TauE/SafE family protein [Bacteroidales bacterium]
MRRTLAGLVVVGLVAAGVLYTRDATMGAHAQHGHAAIATVDLLGFLALGLLGGFGHCVGMCSPFVLYVSRRAVGPGGGSAGVVRSHAAAVSSESVMAAQFWYNGGRIFTYAVLGGVAGALGGGVEMAGAMLGVQRAAKIVAGTVLVAWALAALLDLSRLEVGANFFTRIVSIGKRNVPAHPFATGLFLGLLPCGFLYSAVVAAIGRGGPLEGAVALTLFGLGTTPALLGVSLADELLARRRVLLNRLSQVFILVMGTWLLWTAVKG